MKRYMRTIAAAGAAAVLSGSAYAGGLGLYGAYWSPSDFDSGFGPGVKAVFDGGSPLGFEIRGAWFPDLSDDIDTAAGLVDFDLQAIPLEIGLVISAGANDAPFVPYVSAGGSYFMLDLETDGPGGEESIDIDDEIGWYAGGGFHARLSDSISFFVEGMYRSVEGTVVDDDVEDIDNDVAIDLSGFSANAGIMFGW